MIYHQINLTINPIQSMILLKIILS